MARHEPDYLAPGGVMFWVTLAVAIAGAVAVLLHAR